MNDLSHLPLVSVIIPTYNRMATIGRSISSVLSQTYKNVEIVVVDDGSDDGTESYVEGLNDARIKYLKTGGRYGACHARNVGVRESVGELLAFQDSDDVWLPHKLACQVEHMLSSGVDAVFSQFVRITEGMTSCAIYPNLDVKIFFTVYPPGLDNNTQKLLRGNILGTPTLLISRKVFSALGGFDEGMPRFQDWDLAIKLFSGFSVGFVNEPLVNAYLQGDSITYNRSAANEAVLRILTSNRDIYRKYQWYRFMHVIEIVLRSARDLDHRSLVDVMRFLAK